MFYTYVLQSSKDQSLYYGYTNDLKRRIEEHNKKENDSTKHKAPWTLIYYEACLLESDARRRESYLKTSQGRHMLRRRIKDHLSESTTRQNSTTGYAR